MDNFKSVDEVLDFAINQEQEAIDFYSELANKASREDIKKIYLDFVKEEIGHKVKLMKVKEEKSLVELPDSMVTDLKISDYLVPVKATPDMSYQDALIVVMNKEKAAYRLYSSLAKMAPTEDTRNLFQKLALEEANHKLQFETEYDDNIMRDN
ncbi:MAG: rubrerythrin [Bacteroidetes bacterium]|nr:MAG: rubrerythrin [Bacteroidota bacterium]